MPNDSAELALAASSGDSPAIEALYERHLPAFRAYVRLRMGKLLRGKETESDIVQSVFHDILSNLSGLKWHGEAAFKHLLFEKGRRKIVDHARHFHADRRNAARELNKSGDLPSIEECHRSLGTPSQFAMGHEQVDKLELAFEELPEDYAEVIVNSRFLKLSSKEIADRMGRSVGAVHVLLSRALARLSTILQDTDEGR